ncbi:MAG: rhodanese-like domain-containing protein [Bacteriovoracia bacterium]
MSEMSVQDYQLWRKQNKKHLLLDVRFKEEKNIADIGGTLIPLPELERRWRELPDDQGPVVVYCHHGMRSMNATLFLKNKGVEALSLAGGIDAWSREIDPSVPLY